MTAEPKNYNEQENELEFYLGVKAFVDQNVDSEVMTLSQTNQKIDIASITKKCEERFFSDLGKEIEDLVGQLPSFFRQLELDNKIIYDKIYNQLVGLSKTSEEFTNLIKSCITFKELNNLSSAFVLTPEDLKKLYDQGKNWFTEEDYNKAFLYFLFLTSIDSQNAENWIARGMSEQNLGRFNEAIATYMIVIKLDPDYLLNYLQIIDCLILNKQLNEASQLYSTFMREIDPTDYSDSPFLLSKLEGIKNFINKLKT